ncbi:MAG: hypothetical protein ACO208_08200, partial [Candidatus Puniceispirillaceae bacterium]
MSTIVNSWNEWDPLKHVIVGRADDCHIPPEEPALDAKVPEDGIVPTKLFSRRADVDKINSTELGSLEGELVNFQAYIGEI